ncbi:MAG TPA: hypothetical protein PKL15_02330 [Saprospiraceae bacterium]|nr:hypothetical protein [Saprospiraceae bacterium]HNM24232.1 hypothetical protein [Saprospiraceae bacterium]
MIKVWEMVCRYPRAGSTTRGKAGANASRATDCNSNPQKAIRGKTLLLFLLLSLRLAAQIDTAKSKYGLYFFEGDEVVFEFDKRVYENALHSADSNAVDFADLDILQITVSGDFNNWSAEGWVMQRMDANRYQLRKHLKDFRDAPDWQFRFLINGTYWTPVGVVKKEGVLGRYDLQGPEVAPPSGDTGNVAFHLRGFTDKKQVILAGTFNNWDEHNYRMRRVDGGWEMRLPLPPGVYEYKFIADGEWLHDPANPEKKRNQYGTFNSVLHVATPVHFELQGFNNAREVILSGSFNNWKEHEINMQRTPAGWAADVPLTGGKYLYKFIVDGQWMTDPANPRTETDTKGHVNSVLFVR